MSDIISPVWVSDIFHSHSILANPLGLEPGVLLVPCIVWPSDSGRARFAETDDRQTEKKDFQQRVVPPSLSTAIITFWQNNTTEATVWEDLICCANSWYLLHERAHFQCCYLVCDEPPMVPDAEGWMRQRLPHHCLPHHCSDRVQVRTVRKKMGEWRPLLANKGTCSLEHLLSQLFVQGSVLSS